jgi:4-diphosphocytidyl-2-C-methyl-D-erythritol kinase
MGGVRILSPGKVNLHLQVGPRREDGYHEIVSLLQMIGIYDEIVIRSLKDEGICLVRGDFDCTPEDNLISRAVKIFREETGISTGVSITVNKHIPAGAGLGGGSGNAASVLTALNRLFAAGLSRKEITDLGGHLGSDVPFFCGTASAVATGRGEELLPVEPREDLWAVVVSPEEEISTRDAYGWFDEDVDGGEIDFAASRGIIDSYIQAEPSEWRFVNSLFSPVSRRKPFVAEAVLRIGECGADFTRMSGSGSSCFGIFTERPKAEFARSILRNTYNRVWVARLLAQSPGATILYNGTA